ncbi:PREDICTED: uncharacterized protein LOC105457212 [Wasmannia auropunctata]|uniref:uncharacterized protein LOC105457212 n=1 Tax=Wasmannia auropunctata TaxID=64793 RepID=UPI0005EFCF4F|nr:PREDICTED: uncharacterized protein LOC105457212 [Wasmannia auropunctata]
MRIVRFEHRFVKGHPIRAPTYHDLAEKSRYHCGSFNSHRCVCARDIDSRACSRIRSYYDLSDTPKAGIRAESMDLPETYHGAAGAINVDSRLFLHASRAYFAKLTL